MLDAQTQQRFIALRSQGWSFGRIAQELRVCKQTLITWSRKFQFQIHNLRAIELEALQHQLLDSQETRLRALAEQLRRAQAELAKRDFAKVPTSRLYSLVESLNRQILRETGGMQFTSPVADIPREEFTEEVQNWIP